MNRQYQVQWALAAQRDLKQIIDYIALESPGNALRILQGIKQKASDLHTFPDTLPDRGRIVPELRDQGIHIYREIIVTPWRIIYRISDAFVFVLAVMDSRRNVEDILLNRLIR